MKRRSGNGNSFNNLEIEMQKFQKTGAEEGVLAVEDLLNLGKATFRSGNGVRFSGEIQYSRYKKQDQGI